MPDSHESTYSEEWFLIAHKDFSRVSIRLTEGDIEDAAFHLQQALEKALKGFLLARGWSRMV
ncbi:HEPN domain-containing protein [Candidatus Poribacteria bacterium]|nr:HEPN domain-containing protein [Candidatus Poribacteria bacterium]